MPPIISGAAQSGAVALAQVGPRKRSFFRRLMGVPWPVKILIVFAIMAAFVFGPVAFVGLAALGTAFGMPALLLGLVVGLGVVGLITVIKSLRRQPVASSHLVTIVRQIAAEESLRRMRKEMREAMTADPVEPQRQACPGSDPELVQMLLRMEPFDFERHVMSFFQNKGMVAWVTKRSNDAGVDGFARHADGLIVVQCKRNAADNPIGRPVVQQFKGVVEENGAWRGFIVTTSYFTPGAVDSAYKNDKLRLVDLNELISWHKRGIEI